jgi:hypothetical protein
MTETAVTAETITVRAREQEPPRRFLPDPADMVAAAHIAQAITTHADITYRHGQTRRILRIFPGGWVDTEVRRDHGGERGPRP